MKDWPSYTVAELQARGVLLVEDGNHGEYRPRPDEFVEDGIAFIRAADMSGGQVQFEQAGTINEVARKRVRKGIGQPGDVLFSHKGTVGKLARVSISAPEFVCSPQTTFWRTLDESQLRRDYLYAFMRSRAFINQWWVRKGETDMADYVSLTAQRQLRVVVPPVETQRLIAAPITAMDDLIENNRRRIEVLEEMARAIYREWFVHFRFPGHEDATFVDSPLGPIPEGWEVTTIGEVAQIDKGLSYKGAFLTDEGTPMANLKCIRADGGFRRDGTKAYSGPSKSKHQVISGDIVMANTDLTQAGGVIGAAALVPQSGFADGGIISHHLFAVRPGERAHRCWLLRTFNDLPFREFARGVASGTTVLGLRARDVEQREVVLPGPGVAEQFEQTSCERGQLAETLHGENEVLASIRDLLLPKLVTGEIDVSDLDLDELMGAS